MSEFRVCVEDGRWVVHTALKPTADQPEYTFPVPELLPPLEHLEKQLAEDARAFAVWDAACAGLVNGEKPPGYFVDERNKAAERWARLSKYAIDAGVPPEKVERTRMQAERARLIADALQATLANLDLSDDLRREALRLVAENLLCRADEDEDDGLAGVREPA